MKDTLLSLHRRSGKSFVYIRDVVALHDPEGAPKTAEAVAMVMRRGTERLPLLRAFAEAWEQPFPTVEAAARETRRMWRTTGHLVNN